MSCSPNSESPVPSHSVEISAARQRVDQARKSEASAATRLEDLEEQLKELQKQVKSAKLSQKKARNEVENAESHLRNIEDKYIGSNKRRKMPAEHTPMMCVTDLHVDVLAMIGDYLPKPSAVMFAVGMAAPLSSWVHVNPSGPPSSLMYNMCTAGASESCVDTLDFEDIEKNLALKLADDDLFAMLLCINATNKLRTLKLAGCTNIKGNGLEPLRGSTILEQLDLSLVGMHESPTACSRARLTESIVLPLLDSIIQNENNSLKHLQFSKRWRRKGSKQLTRFLERYDHVLESRGGTCSNCNGPITVSEVDENDGWVITTNAVLKDHDWSNHYGLQSYTCCKCTNNICDDCRAPKGNVTFIEHCQACDRDYCFDCVQMVKCRFCSKPCFRCKVCVSKGNAGCRA